MKGGDEKEELLTKYFKYVFFHHYNYPDLPDLPDKIEGLSTEDYTKIKTKIEYEIGTTQGRFGIKYNDVVLTPEEIEKYSVFFFSD